MSSGWATSQSLTEQVPLSVPGWIGQYWLAPVSHSVSSLQTLFLAGDVPSVLVPNTLDLLATGVVLLALLVRTTRMRLE